VCPLVFTFMPAAPYLLCLPLLTFAAMKILMVCLGNICRSPLAEGILQQKAAAAGLDWQVDSAGTNGYHIGEAPHPLSQKVARLNGLDISQQRARRFTATDLANYDKIYALAGDVVDEIRRISGRGADLSRVSLLMNELHPGLDEDVPDPYYGAEPGYHEVYQLIDEAADAIVEKYGAAQPASAPNPKKL
jgi:protein-tyrosine phosphatase